MELSNFVLEFNKITEKLVMKAEHYQYKSNKGIDIFIINDKNNTKYINYLHDVKNIINELNDPNLKSDVIELGLFNIIAVGLASTAIIQKIYIDEDGDIIKIEYSYLIMLNTDYVSDNQKLFLKYHEIGHCINDHPLDMVSNVNEKCLTNKELRMEDTLSNLDPNDGISREIEADKYAANITGFKLNKMELLKGSAIATFDTLNDSRNKTLMDDIVSENRALLDEYMRIAISPESIFEDGMNNEIVMNQFNGRICYTDEEIEAM